MVEKGRIEQRCCLLADLALVYKKWDSLGDLKNETK